METISAAMASEDCTAAMLRTCMASSTIFTEFGSPLGDDQSL